MSRTQMAPATRVLCTCRKSATFQCINPATGIPQLGQLVSMKTQKSHLIKSEQHSVWVCGADKQGPSTHFDPSEFVQHELQSHADQAPDSLIPLLIGLSLDSEPPSLVGPSLDPSPLLVGPSSELDPPQDPFLGSDPPQDYNCARFFQHTSMHPTSPTITFISLKTALFYVTEMISTYTSSCMLKMDRELVRLVVTQGLQISPTQKQQSLSTPPILSYADEATIKAIPIDTRTVLKHLAIEPDVTHSFREGIEEALEQTAIRSSTPCDKKKEMSDIYDLRGWRELIGPDGHQFTANSNNITFGMFMDGINPHGNRISGKHVSITFIIMVCLSLPVSMRYNPEDIFLVGIAPGPKEPSLEQTNWILQPIIDQLAVLWKSGLCLLKTFQHPQGQVVSAALLTFFADLPALCRALGFAAPTATQMCSYCLLPKSEINHINLESWPKPELYCLDAKAEEAEKEAEKPQAEAEKKEAEAGQAKANTQPPPLVANKRQPATGKPPKNPQARLPRPPAPEEPETYFLEMLFVSNHRQTSLEVSNFHQLIERLNQIAPLKGANWIASNEWAKSLSNTNAPVTSRVQAYSNLKQGDVVYSNMKTNKSNCVVELKSNSPAKYGMIKMIFTHLRTPPGLHPVSSTWLAVHPLIPVPSNTNPFAQLKKYDSLGVALRRVEYSQEHIVLLDDVLAQCAWMTYKPEELGPAEHLTFKPAETGIVKPALPAGLYRLKTQSMSADLQLGMLLLPVRRDPTQPVGPHNVVVPVEFLANFELGPPNHPGARDFSLRTRMIALQSEPGAKIVINKAHNGPTDVQVKLVDLIEATLAGAGGLVVMSGYTHWTVFLRGCPGHDTIAVEGRRLTNDMIRLACSAEQVRQGAALIRLEQQDRAILDRIPLGRNAPELAISSLTTNACRPTTLTTGFLNDHTLTRPPLSDYLQRATSHKMLLINI
ncbi:hypothetical protein PSHT_01289 [Puccinia striiformis]|uniref:Uncharacterized protein n=1 Tax=Puccinia striiformis TaxID=27350 RepID=A0A2S4WL00_9BASI|nr:hypothetical protein PSHT_01289 [Puccinia striiformis]